MTLNYDEINLIAIYRKDNRRDTIREIAEMATDLSPDEGELMALADKAIKKLKSMSDDEFDSLELEFDFSA